MGRKSYLFVYYVKLINIELWMVEKGMTLNGGLESRTVEKHDKKENLKAM